MGDIFRWIIALLCQIFSSLERQGRTLSTLTPCLPVCQRLLSCCYQWGKIQWGCTQNGPVGSSLWSQAAKHPGADLDGSVSSNHYPCSLHLFFLTLLSSSSFLLGRETKLMHCMCSPLPNKAAKSDSKPVFKCGYKWQRLSAAKRCCSAREESYSSFKGLWVSFGVTFWGL